MCCQPNKAFKTGMKTDHGKDELIICPGVTGDRLNVQLAKKPINFNALSNLAFIDGNWYLVNPVPIPCGKCVQCRMQSAKEWKIRAVLESQFAMSSWFLTLTYSDSCLPTDKETGEAILHKEDLQRFFKRLRKKGLVFRYLACGEYSPSGRPHYHMILFLRNSKDLDFHLEAVNHYSSCFIQDAWPFGLIDLEEAYPGSMAYVAGYVEKKCKDDYLKWPVPPFRLVSRKPGLGFEYFAKNKDKLLLDPNVYGDFGSTNHCPMPQYFIYLLENHGAELRGLKQARKLQGIRFSLVEDVIYGESDKEKIGFEKHEMLSKKLTKVRSEKYD